MPVNSSAPPPAAGDLVASTGVDPSGIDQVLAERDVALSQQADRPTPAAAPMPAAIVGSAPKRREWRELDPADRALVTEQTLARWVGDLAVDDYTLDEVVLREKRRLTNLKSFRQGGELTDTEWKLWRFLGRHEGKVCTKLQIARHLWGGPDRPIHAWMLRNNESGNASPLVAHLQNIISDLRSKLEIDPIRPQHLATVRGVGYVWYDAPPSTDDQIDYAGRQVRFSKLREEMLGLIYGPALEAGPEIEVSEQAIEGEVVEAASHPRAPHDSRVRPGPEYERLERQRAARRPQPQQRQGTDWRGVPFPETEREPILPIPDEDRRP